MKKLIAYYRCSTKRQSRSGLGLDAQRHAAQQYAKSIDARIVAEYTEVESGRSNARPELANAIGNARLAKATICVAKWDRLSRNVAFLSQLLDSKVDFVACDNPHANKVTIQIMAVLAEAEALACSIRTKDALAAAKRNGVLLGSARPGAWRGREHVRLAAQRKAVKAAAIAHRRAASEAYAFLVPTMQERRERGDSLWAVATWLNEQGHTTRSGKSWSDVAVMRVMRRAS
jgi:DNA invertase Pin-like site-specific DNA recombinase